MKVVLINPYELGRQPFALAHPAAWLALDGCTVQCLDLSLQKLDTAVIADAEVVAIHVGMHTATRIAAEAIPRIRLIAPQARLCVYGLYAPMNADFLRALGVEAIFGGEFEPGLRSLVSRVRAGNGREQPEPVVNLAKIEFMPPDRAGLPPLGSYAHLRVPDTGNRVVGFIEASRGCKHLCRHCPVVPVYKGRFRIVPADVVMADVRQQIAMGAQHISFGDPDFFNGPTHALKVMRALHAEFPQVTYDVTIKIQHLIERAELIPVLKETGCLFITSAVESVDDRVLGYLAKNHTSRDFDEAVTLVRAAGIALAPTFVPFTPWTTLQGYLGLLRRLVELRLVESVPPIQLAIRLLIPEGSYLLELPGFREQVELFDARILGYPWKNADGRVDLLQREIQALVAEGDSLGLDRSELFVRIWRAAHAACGEVPPELPADSFGHAIPSMSEPWYCCAEPTEQQLQSF
ncbi:MAG: CUAEP/CCAEP-tail radical SAM (seleno)protein [Acidiferrobacterales bacterium]